MCIPEGGAWLAVFLYAFSMKVIDSHILDRLILEAKNSLRLRKNLNHHEAFSDPINRMLNAFEPGTYVRPHKHENPDKREVFLILRGRLEMCFFDDSGKLISHFLLDPEIGNYGIEIPPSVWHTVVSLKSGTVVYEIKDGPYQVETDKNFASWAPEEGTVDCQKYLESLHAALGTCDRQSCCSDF